MGSWCRVPLRNRTGHQRISPDVQTGCISCCSGDGKFGAPIWWNTPVDDDDVEAEADGQQHRSQWAQPVCFMLDRPKSMVHTTLFDLPGLGAISLLTCAGASLSRRCVEGRMARLMTADPAECCAGQGVGGPQQEAGGARR